MTHIVSSLILFVLESLYPLQPLQQLVFLEDLGNVTMKIILHMAIGASHIVLETRFMMTGIL